MKTHGFVKRFWVENWRNPGQSFTWPISVERAGEYEVTLMLSAPPGSEIEIEGPKSKLRLVSTAAHPEYDGWNWNRIALPAPLTLPAGNSTISIRLLQAQTSRQGAALKSIELLNVTERPAMDVRIQAFRADTKWMDTAKFGIMCQCGGWSYPPHGPKKPWPGMVDAFDVGKYVEMVASTGAGYAVWSATWATYYFAAPISAIDDILPGRTSKRDLIGEIADGLAKRNMRLILYYHAGHSDKEWWARNWVSPDDKTLFVKKLVRHHQRSRRTLQSASRRLDVLTTRWSTIRRLMSGWAQPPRPEIPLDSSPTMPGSDRGAPTFRIFSSARDSRAAPTCRRQTWESGRAVPMKALHAHGNFEVDGPKLGNHEGRHRD